MERKINQLAPGAVMIHEGSKHTVVTNRPHNVRANKNILQLKDRFGIVQTYTIESNKSVITH
jgi:hypothetical protein